MTNPPYPPVKVNKIEINSKGSTELNSQINNPFLSLNKDTYPATHHFIVSKINRWFSNSYYIATNECLEGINEYLEGINICLLPINEYLLLINEYLYKLNESLFKINGYLFRINECLFRINEYLFRICIHLYGLNNHLDHINTHLWVTNKFLLSNAINFNCLNKLNHTKVILNQHYFILLRILKNKGTIFRQRYSVITYEVG